MAFVRKVRTASGATAVQVVEKRRGKLLVIKHVGSAHTDAELGLLMDRAGEILVGDQGVLDLGIEDPVRQESLLPGPGRQPRLLEPAHTVDAAPVVSRPHTLGAVSDVLWSTLEAAYSNLGFDVVGDEVFKQVVLARLVEPTSKRDTVRVLTELGVPAPHVSTIYRHLARAQEKKYRDTITSKCFAHAVNDGDVSLVMYDVTTLYFEAEHEDGLRKVGYSKERRVDPQIVVGLLVDRTGFPLEIGCFEGSKAETKTLLEVIGRFQARHDIADMVVVADAGMLSAANLKELDAAGLRFIVGSRVTKAPNDLASHFRRHGDAFTDGQIVDTVTPRYGRTATNDVLLREEPVWNPEQMGKDWRAVWAFSRKRALRDQQTLNLQANRAQEIIDGQRQVKSARFVKTTAAGRKLDEAALKRARRLVGLKGYVTNIPATMMPAEEIISSYHDLWRVEQSFRMSKSDLAARPIFHHTRDAIEAHLTIVFTALAVARHMQDRTGLSLKQIITTLRPIHAALIEINGKIVKIPARIPDNAAKIIAQINAEPGH